MSEFKAGDKIIRVMNGHILAPLGFVSTVNDDGESCTDLEGGIFFINTPYWELATSAPAAKPQEPAIKITKCQYLDRCYCIDLGRATLLFDGAKLDYDESLSLKHDFHTACIINKKDTAEVLGLLRELNIKVEGIK